MVPVKVREKNMCVDGMLCASVVCFLRVLFLRELLAQVAESGAAVKDVDVPVDAHLNAGGIAAIAHVF